MHTVVEYNHQHATKDNSIHVLSFDTKQQNINIHNFICIAYITSIEYVTNIYLTYNTDVRIHIVCCTHCLLIRFNLCSFLFVCVCVHAAAVFTYLSDILSNFVHRFRFCCKHIYMYWAKKLTRALPTLCKQKSNLHSIESNRYDDNNIFHYFMMHKMLYLFIKNAKSAAY